MSYIIRNAFGFWCAACGENLTQEDADFQNCPTCGGEGFHDENDDEPDQPPEG
jgi:Zn finger protein HypA/HybF involved in hydrogenase expression